MRLSKIKLAGFKSFVDPTVLHLPSNLIGIVGPNGCGKSNIIDAVRWVMGESSARSLRGEAMTDVIFNGAANRKPVGQASIELVFDNHQGRMGGPWASYAEIAIKRLVGRDGQSSYFLNGTRCRRRDIADIFLGTGLGPRSYAIIEQGMISRVIEAKPEELRIFLEEAAGISKYKERRRETETRIRHTRENLERLNDVRDELGRQLQHLQRQARAASQYREYRAEERRLRAELLTLRWRNLRADLQASEQALHRQETVLEAILAEQRQLEARLEAGRIQRAELSDAYNDTQGRYYQIGAEINRLEQYLQHQHELRRRREDDWRQVAMALERIEAQRTQDRTQQTEWAQELVVAEPELAQALAAEAAAEAALAVVELALRQGQADWEAFGRRNSEAQRQIEVERTRIEHLERQLVQGERRLDRLQHEQEQLNATDLDSAHANLRSLEQEIAVALQQDQERLAQIEAESVATREALRQVEHRSRLLREQMQTGRGRLTSLQTLQEAALGRHAAEVNDWLGARALTHAPRLAEQLAVESSWEGAVEAVLADWLDAVCVPDLDAVIRADGADLKNGRLTLLEPSTALRTDAPASALATKVHAPWPLTDLLGSVDIAADVAEMLARRTDLTDGAALVTPNGEICGRHWLRLGQAADESVLQREQEIRQLEAALRKDEASLAQQTAETERLRLQLHDELEPQQRALQQTVNQRHRDHARTQGEANALRSRWEHARERHAALGEEQAELEEQCGQAREQRQLAQSQLAEALLILEELRTEQAELAASRARLDDDLRRCRAQANNARQKAAGQVTAVETLRTRLTAVEQALERLEAQQLQLRDRQAGLERERAADADAALTDAEADLAHALDRQLKVETELRDAREALETQEAELETGERDRSDCERRAESQRRVIEEQRLALSEARVRQQNLREQLHELACEPETIAAGLPVDAAESDWLARLEQVERRIQRLGPINLAAIEECTQLTERKHYLDAQNDDLLEALTTLENAIRKIDRETRSRFRETFDRVNTGLGELFPRLFGGGQAHLDLTGEDVLDAGVAIMAKPPGKRIGSLSLLSGGEKALTAVALVFAIFQLNPAPFCLLDEVDAPLDEANVGRFGALVRELSGRVQFIFVTHNKATMEIAEHLAGVTMQEPGVSRLVAVDVGEAARLAAVG